MKQNIIIILIGLTLIACGNTASNGDSNGGNNVGTVSVISTQPTDGSSKVLTNTVVSASFDADMDITSLDTNSFSLAGGSPVSGSISYDAASRTASFIPDVPLSPGTQYTATLTTSVTASNSATLEEVYTWSFTSEDFIKRVSVDSSGSEIAGDSYEATTSADGRYVAFSSDATNLVTGDTNGHSDVFVHDSQTGTTTRVSVDSSGKQAINGNSYPHSISSDGRYVAFRSSATNLVANDTNGQRDIFVHDTQTGSTTRVNVDSSGNQTVNGHSYAPSISADGRYVAFHSSATNLVADDTNGQADIFMHDTQTNTTIRVNVGPSGSQANFHSTTPSISANGRYVAFESSATNLIAVDTNDVDDVFVHDTQAGTTTRVSVDSSGTQAINGRSHSPSISADGRYVAFESYATNLVTNDTNGQRDIFVHDTKTGTTTRVNINSSNTQAMSYDGENASISADGRYVVFESTASNLVNSDTNVQYDVFRVLNAAP
ncbi:MAG: Ig-like domain-containing protein [Gammaproteobacteria bacterium]|nr:Ig-like domain-containing protein [Gammaproteobacteria bacterium]